MGQTHLQFEKSAFKRLRSYNDVAKENGHDPLTIEHFGHLPEEERVSAFGEHKSKAWAKALNGKNEDGTPYVPNFNDGSRKWFGWYWMNDQEGDVPGAGFRLGGGGYDLGYSGLGARHLFRTKEGFQHYMKYGFEDAREMMKW